MSQLVGCRIIVLRFVVRLCKLVSLSLSSPHHYGANITGANNRHLFYNSYYHCCLCLPCRTDFTDSTHKTNSEIEVKQTACGVKKVLN